MALFIYRIGGRNHGKVTITRVQYKKFLGVLS